MARDGKDAYWKANRRLILLLLGIWALVSFGFGILLAEPLAGWTVGRLPMGFWWAHQGSMVVFVILIFVYAKRMDVLDERYGVQEGDREPWRHRGRRRERGDEEAAP